MKRKLLLLSVLLMLALAVTGCRINEKKGENTMGEDSKTTITAVPSTAPTAIPTAAAMEVLDTETATLYKDGVYEVETSVDAETYITKATVTIEGGKITAVDWTIYDISRDNKPFDSEYYHVYEGVSDVYVKQAKDDWSGSRGYADVLIETQDVNQVDAVSGATWTNRKFKEIVKMALKKASE